MNNNILPKTPDAIFEPHILDSKKLPFIYHHSCVRNRGVENFHENLELLYFKKGNASVKYADEHFPVTEGDVVVVNSYITHKVFSEEPVERVCLIIDNNFCKNHGIDVSQLIFTSLIHDEELNQYYDKIIYAYSQKHKFKHFEIRCAVLNLLLYLCVNYSKTNPDSSLKYYSCNYVRKSIEYIKQNLDKKITADAVATSVGLSKFHFLREFKKQTGFTLIHYINIIRCEYAKDLLNSGKYSVKNVAVLCGFDNFSYFTNVFKKYTNHLPSDYLK